MRKNPVAYCANKYGFVLNKLTTQLKFSYEKVCKAIADV